MFEKISVVQQSLHKYYPLFFQEHENNIRSLDKLRSLRNKYAHSRIEWNDKNEDKNNFHFVTMKRDGLKREKYKTVEAWIELNKFRASILGLLELIHKFLS